MTKSLTFIYSLPNISTIYSIFEAFVLSSIPLLLLFMLLVSVNLSDWEVQMEASSTIWLATLIRTVHLTSK